MEPKHYYSGTFWAIERAYGETPKYCIASFTYLDEVDLEKGVCDVVGATKSANNDASLPSIQLPYFEGMDEEAMKLYSGIVALSSGKDKSSISIDYRLLHNDDVMSLIAYTFSFDTPEERVSNILTVDITGEYVLNEGDYLNLRSYFPNATLLVHSVEENLIGADRIVPTNGKFTVSTCSLFEKEEKNNVINAFILEDMEDEEFVQSLDYISAMFDGFDDRKPIISFRYYRPTQYKELLLALKELGIPENITINFIGSPLYEDSSLYEELQGILPNNITITYNTCKDMIDKYCEPPYDVSQYYDSELEGGGIVELDGYVRTLQIIEEQEKHIKEMGYTPLEASIYVYKYLFDNHYYDPFANDTDSIDYTTNRDIDKVIDKKSLVCVGYGNLYSLLLRRCGIPMFRYSTTQHVRNVGRIRDEKYDFDMIGICDPTWDGVGMEEDGTLIIPSEPYQHFMMEPEDMLRMSRPVRKVRKLDKDTGMIVEEDVVYLDFLTIPGSLVIDGVEEIDNSASYRQLLVTPDYNPAGYTYTMLRLMGYEFENLEEYQQLVAELNQTSVLKIRDKEKYKETIRRALETVLRRENPNITDEEIMVAMEEFDASMRIRAQEYGADDTRIDFNLDGTGIAHVDLSPNAYNKDLDDKHRMRPYSKTKHVVRDEPVAGDDTIYYGTNIGGVATVYAPPTREEPVTVHINDGVSTVYAPPTREEPVTVHINDGISTVYGPPPMEDPVEVEDNVEYIPGTKVPKPRMMNPNETDEEYALFLRDYYAANLPGFVDDYYWPGTDIPKPRAMSPDETEEQYVSYLRKHYAKYGYQDENYIAGTDIPKPRGREYFETEQDYVSYLENYYCQYFPEASLGRYALKKDQIIQDEPIRR